MVSLIANSGIQFYNVVLDLGPKSAAQSERIHCFELTHEEDEQGNRLIEYIPPSDIVEYNGQYIQKSVLNDSALDTHGRLVEEKIEQASVRVLREDAVLTIRAKEAIEVFENVWLPAPYFRLQHYDRNQALQGPQTWARMRFSRRTVRTDGDGSSVLYDLTFAFDTNCSKAEDLNSFEYLVPSLADAENGSHFASITDDSAILFWLDKPWLSSWLETEIKRKRSQIEQRFPNFDQYQWLHIGYYLALLKGLKRARGFPEVSFHTHPQPIEVDLVLDLGNSRTCGLVIESAAKDAVLNITDAKPLKIRNLSKPAESSGDPFDMRVAFVRETFGQESVGPLSKNDHAFKYPSIVRIGKEATELSCNYDTADANSIFSSPKRYLWDDRKAEHSWTFIPIVDEKMAKPAIDPAISPKFTSDGRLLARAEVQSKKFQLAPPYSAIDAYYSRRSLMTFSLIEIILQAITYINSFEYRTDKIYQKTPRKLRRIVLTCPTAMLKTEKVMLREAALDALAALKDHFGNLVDASPEIDIDYENLQSAEQEKNCPVVPAPSVVARQDLDEQEILQLTSLTERQKRSEWGFDEATCSQLTFIFSEISHRFKNENVHLYFDTVGKLRQNSQFEGQPAVTLASIDIGGGTTDLMIAAYQTDPGIAAPVITPDPLFWEGFNLAGDNLLKRLIEQIVLPTIGETAHQCGDQNYLNTMNGLFGPFHGNQSHADRIQKRYFVQQIAMPIAHGILQHAQENLPPETRNFDSFFHHYNAPSDRLVEYLNQTFRQNGAKNFNLKNVEWQLDNRMTNEVVRNIFEEMLRDLCNIISFYQVDYVLLSGRPTTLPVVRDIVLRYLPTTPDRIVPMGNYRVGPWYPFAKDGFIRDPKTCVAVGAAIALMAGTLNRMEGFALKTDLLANKVVSTADYIGLFKEASARVPTVYFDPAQTDFQVNFFTTIFLGMRQMDSENWIASPMYKLSFASKELALELRNQCPLTVSLRIKDRQKDKEKIEIISIRGKGDSTQIPNSSLSLKLQTLTDEHGYWLDTGIFNLDKVGGLNN